ncbi:MAG: hypothetical protein EOP04_03665 [Proteobacteria bacterium]|nr:MAG: hypothetical protein EOP04_03665 [Pseudomonadota bacterium]
MSKKVFSKPSESPALRHFKNLAHIESKKHGSKRIEALEHLSLTIYKQPWFYVRALLAHQPKTVQLDSDAGSNITDIVTEAVALAKASSSVVEILINKVHLRVSETDEIKSVVNSYRGSLPQPNNQDRQFNLNNQKQLETNNLLDDILRTNTEIDIVEWICRFADVSDWEGVEYDKELLLMSLKARGFVKDDCVDNDLVKTDKEIFAKWFAGQAITMLEDGYGISSRMIEYKKNFREI